MRFAAAAGIANDFARDVGHTFAQLHPNAQRVLGRHVLSGGAAALNLGDGNQRQSLWNRIGSALPLIALAAGLILIHSIENDRRASEVAEVDTALLSDDLPPAAYADPGFIQFLKTVER